MLLNSFKTKILRSHHLRERFARRAFSLLEMVMAATLVAGTLVPTMGVMRDAMAKSRDLNRRNLLSNYAVSVLEAQAAMAMTNWTSTTTTGNFSADGHTTIRYSATRSDAPADGGLTGQLMHVQVTVFDDTDGDTTADANELSVLYRTKVAHLQSYEDEE
jgi:type II secretory pathway pseudopilin PulG